DSNGAPIRDLAVALPDAVPAKLPRAPSVMTVSGSDGERWRMALPPGEGGRASVGDRGPVVDARRGVRDRRAVRHGDRRRRRLVARAPRPAAARGDGRGGAREVGARAPTAGR